VLEEELLLLRTLVTTTAMSASTTTAPIPHAYGLLNMCPPTSYTTHQNTAVNEWEERYNLCMQRVAFGGGCFWCAEAVFKLVKGVEKVLPGYSGGTKEDANYTRVSTGQTNHAEVVYLEYDPKETSFKNLLTIFFASHDPTTVNRQGNDIGFQYRSVIFYATEDQRKEAEDFIKELNASNSKGSPIVTELNPLENFYEAEDYHKDYFANNPNQGYCQLIINPKLEKVQKEFANLLKSGSF
jgi:peptide-methionine (S)-S-oxide reductase